MFESEAHENHSSCTEPPLNARTRTNMRNDFLTPKLNSTTNSTNLIFRHSRSSLEISKTSFRCAIACALYFSIIIHSCEIREWNSLVSLLLRIVKDIQIWNLSIETWKCILSLFFPLNFHKSFYAYVWFKATVISMDQHIFGVRAMQSVAVPRRMQHYINVHWLQIIRIWALLMNAKAFHSSKILSLHQHLIVLRFQSHKRSQQSQLLRLLSQHQFRLRRQKLRHKQSKKFIPRVFVNVFLRVFDKSWLNSFSYTWDLPLYIFEIFFWKLNTEKAESTSWNNKAPAGVWFTNNFRTFIAICALIRFSCFYSHIQFFSPLSFQVFHFTFIELTI